jgi:uncharacterized protein
MIPQDRDLIESVFSRLSQMAGAPKDPEAAALIAERLRALPDATYGLVQAVAMQDIALKQAQARIAELERRVAEGAAPAVGGGGFLGAPAGNPPVVNPPVVNPWAPSPPRGLSPMPQVPPQQQYAPQPQYAAQPAPSPWGGQAAAGGGFLRSAATTAAGVAGGMLLAEGVSSLFSGHHGGGFGGGFGGGGFGGGGYGGGGETITENTVVNNYYGDSAPVDDTQQVSADDGDLGYDDSSDSGGGDSWL